MANRNFNSNKLYQFENYGVLLSCNFVVDPTNGNGLGIRSLKGAGISNVFMHTSATPGAGANGYLNPNPAVGVILVQFQDPYFRYLGGFSGFVSPVSGTPLTATTAHTSYTIVSLGTATLAQWQAVGLPVGVTPAVGASFVATASATIGGSAAVEAVLSTGSGISSIEVQGDPNQTINAVNPAVPYQNTGGWMVLNCFTGADAIAAPAAGSVAGLNFYLSNSSVTVSGQ